MVRAWSVNEGEHTVFDVLLLGQVIKGNWEAGVTYVTRRTDLKRQEVLELTLTEYNEVISRIAEATETLTAVKLAMEILKGKANGQEA